ncbi:uncharacterized protein LOC110454636 isoform X1 [Mizuhopecten yessoensis]|nr:uncharacterized protein LOC110454636 isoform X1 [Mizuhopecten yessoensis]
MYGLPALIQVLTFSVLICCIRHGLSLEPDDKLQTLGNDEPNKRQLEQSINPLGGSRVLLALLPRDDESDSKEQPPQFDYAYQIKREKDGRMIICGRTTCPPGTEVNPCKINNSDDTCIGCPPGKQMLDQTRSEAYVLHCVDIPSCHNWPGTVETAENHKCTGGFRMRCRCNTEDGKCGYDPCHCMKRSCAEGESLQQNCTCKPLVEPEVTTRRTRVSTTSSPQLTPNEQDHLIQNKIEETAEQPLPEERFPTRHQKGVIFPIPFPREEKEGLWPDADDWKTIWTSVPITILVIILLLCCIGWTCFRKKTRKLFTDCRHVFNSSMREFAGRLGINGN